MVKRLGIWYNRDILIEMVKAMQNKFKSKIDWWFHLAMALYIFFMAALFVSSAYVEAPYNSSCALTFVVLLIFFLALLLPSYLFTYYVFEENGLRIRSGLGRGRFIPYCDIISCLPQTQRSQDSAALSKERLAITYRKKGNEKTISISPKEQYAFMGELDVRKKGKTEK